MVSGETEVKRQGQRVASLFLSHQTDSSGPWVLSPCAGGGEGSEVGTYLKVIYSGDGTVGGGSPLVPLPQGIPGLRAEQPRSLFFLEILYQR